MLPKKHLSINEEIFYLGLISFFVILLVFGIFFSIGFFRINIEHAKNLIQEKNMKINIFTEGFFREITNTLKVLSKNENIINATTEDQVIKEEVLSIYKKHAEANKNIAYIYSGYEDGSLLINDYTPEEGYDPRERPWYLAALRNNPEPSVGLPYREAQTEDWLLSQSRVLINKDGEITGVVTIDCAIVDLINLIQRKYTYHSQRSYILNDEGEIIYHPDDQYIGQIFPEIRDGVAGSDSGELRYNFEGEKTWGYYSTIESTGWKIVTAMDSQEVIRPLIYQIMTYILIIIFLSLILSWIQSKVFGKRFAEPLNILRERIKAITEGKSLQEKTYQHFNQEIIELMNNIERLTASSLKKKANELETVIKSIQEGMLVVNNKQDIIYMNIRFKEMWNIEDYKFNNLNMLFKKLRKQVRKPEGIIEDYLEFQNTSQTKKEIINLKDHRVFEVFTCPLIEEDRVDGRLWSFRDITDRRQTEKKLRKMANTDSMTGIYNRRFFLDKTSEEFKRAKRYQLSLSLMMMDIDHFKRVNDTYGHAAGDAVIKDLVKLVKKGIREVDIAGRLGGEEFGVLLPETDIKEAEIVGERIRKMVEKNTVNYENVEITITISIGITTFYEETKDVDQMLIEADDALYNAKNRGRNCVIKFGEIKDVN